MMKRTVIALVAVAICAAQAQEGSNGYAQDTKIAGQMQAGAYDYEVMGNGSKWMGEIFAGMNPRDRMVLKQALWNLPHNEEYAVRTALQKAHKGSDAMYSKFKSGDSSASMTERKFMMGPADVWNVTLDSLTTAERRMVAVVYERMQPSERDALMAALTARYESHWNRAKNSTRTGAQ